MLSQQYISVQSLTHSILYYLYFQLFLTDFLNYFFCFSKQSEKKADFKKADFKNNKNRKL